MKLVPPTDAEAANSWVWRLPERSGFGRSSWWKFVHSPARLDLFRGNGQAKLFLERPADSAAQGVWLPAGGLDDLSDGGAVGRFEHLDKHRLLVWATLDRGRQRDTVLDFGCQSLL